MKIKTILVVILFTYPLTGCSPASKTNPETQAMIDEFFRAYKTEGHRSAVIALLSKNKWITNEDVNKVANEIDEIASQVGKYYGYELIAENTYGQNLVQYIYVVKYERQPIKYTFRFYKPNEKWMMQSFNYEMDFIGELDEAGKGYRLKENVAK